MKKILFTILVFVLQVAVADDRPAAPEEEALKQATARFMTRVTDKQIAEAVDDLVVRYWFDKSDLDKMKVALTGQLEAELNKAEIALGKRLPKEYEFLGIKRLGKSCVKLVYLQKFENCFLPWSFMFYRSRDEFKLVMYNMGDAAGDDLKAFTITEPAR